MQRLEGLVRKAVQDYEMISPGDRVCVGVSGGKDSVALTVALGRLRRYLGVPYEVVAVTLDPCFGGVETDYSPLAELFAAERPRSKAEYRYFFTSFSKILIPHNSQSPLLFSFVLCRI